MSEIEFNFEDQSQEVIDLIKSIKGLKIEELSINMHVNKFMSQSPINSYRYGPQKNTISPAEKVTAITLLQPLEKEQSQGKESYSSLSQSVYNMHSTNKFNMHNEGADLYTAGLSFENKLTDISAQSGKKTDDKANHVVADYRKYHTVENGNKFNEQGNLSSIYDSYRSTEAEIFHVHIINLQPNTVIKLDHIIDIFESSTKLSATPNMNNAGYTQSIAINNRNSSEINISDKGGVINTKNQPVNINDLKETPRIFSAEIQKNYSTIQLHTNPNGAIKHNREFSSLAEDQDAHYQFFEFKVEEILGVYDTNLYLDENDIVQKHYKNGPKLIDTNNDGKSDALLTGNHLHYKVNKNGPFEEMVLPKTHLLIDVMVKPVGGGEAFQAQIAVTHHAFQM